MSLVKFVHRNSSTTLVSKEQTMKSRQSTAVSHFAFVPRLRVGLVWIAAALSALIVPARLSALIINEGDLVIADVSNARLIGVDFDAASAQLITEDNLMTGTSGIVLRM